MDRFWPASLHLIGVFRVPFKLSREDVTVKCLRTSAFLCVGSTNTALGRWTIKPTSKQTAGIRPWVLSEVPSCVVLTSSEGMETHEILTNTGWASWMLWTFPLNQTGVQGCTSARFFGAIRVQSAFCTSSSCVLLAFRHFFPSGHPVYQYVAIIINIIIKLHYQWIPWYFALLNFSKSCLFNQDLQISHGRYGSGKRYYFPATVQFSTKRLVGLCCAGQSKNHQTKAATCKTWSENIPQKNLGPSEWIQLEVFWWLRPWWISVTWIWDSQDLQISWSSASELCLFKTLGNDQVNTTFGLVTLLLLLIRWVHA